MSDVFTKAKRSEVMSRIRSRNNKETELFLVTILRRAKISGWRRQQKVLGKPDFVFQDSQVAVFVDGCFWHLCPKHSNLPSNNKTFWKRKLTLNKARDGYVNRALRRQGWHVVRIWEHDLVKNQDKCIKRIRKALG